MGNLTLALIFVLLINVLMIFANLGVQAANPSANLMNTSGTIIGNAISNDVLNSNVSSQLPNTANGNVQANQQGNFISDSFSMIRSWLLDIPGVRYIVDIVSAPYDILKVATMTVGIPNDVATIIGTLWYLLSLFLVVSWFLWRD